MLREIDALLRGTGRHAAGGGAVPWRTLVAIGCVAGFLYGLVMGYVTIRITVNTGC